MRKSKRWSSTWVRSCTTFAGGSAFAKRRGSGRLGHGLRQDRQQAALATLEAGAKAAGRLTNGDSEWHRNNQRKAGCIYDDQGSHSSLVIGRSRRHLYSRIAFLFVPSAHLNFHSERRRAICRLRRVPLVPQMSRFPIRAFKVSTA